MKTQYIEVNGLDQGINFDTHYKVKGYSGIAFFLLGWAANQEPVLCYGEDEDGNEIEMESGEYELVADHANVVAVMVGDDRRHIVSIYDLTPLSEDGFCRDCGQIGCGCNVYAWDDK